MVWMHVWEQIVRSSLAAGEDGFINQESKITKRHGDGECGTWVHCALCYGRRPKITFFAEFRREGRLNNRPRLVLFAGQLDVLEL